MIHDIKLYLFILSVVYTLKFIIDFVWRFTQEDPEPMVITKIDKSLLYFTIAYILTYFLI